MILFFQSNFTITIVLPSPGVAVHHHLHVHGGDPAVPDQQTQAEDERRGQTCRQRQGLQPQEQPLVRLLVHDAER